MIEKGCLPATRTDGFGGLLRGAPPVWRSAIKTGGTMTGNEMALTEPRTRRVYLVELSYTDVDLAEMNDPEDESEYLEMARWRADYLDSFCLFSRSDIDTLRQEPSVQQQRKRREMEAATTFLRLVASGHVQEAFSRYARQDLRHHNPFFPGDAESLMAAMEEEAARNPDKVLEVKHVLHDENLVAVHSRIGEHADDPGAAAFHLFRFEEGRIVEMWGAEQALPEDSPNEEGMF